MRAIHFTGKRGPVRPRCDGAAARRGGGRKFGALGFTLIEMLVVIAIILIIVRLLLPLVRQAKNTADAAACASNLRQIALGVRMYMDSTEHGFPYINGSWTAAGSGWQYGFRRIASYAIGKTNKVFWCPAHDVARRVARYQFGTNWEYGSYGMNVCIGCRVRNGPPGVFVGGNTGIDNYFWYNVTKSPAEVILCGDGEDDHALLDMGRALLPLNVWYRGSAYGVMGGIRHNGKGNLAFLDGHVESLTDKQTNPTTYNGISIYGTPDTPQTRARDLWLPDSNNCSFPDLTVDPY